MTSLDLSEPFVPAESTAQAPDAVLAAAIDVARVAAVAVGGVAVGDHLGFVGEESAQDGPVVTHAFAASLPGYVGWQWAVSVARSDDSEAVTVDEVVLLPGEGALLAPTWVPWSERIRPGDLSPGDLLPIHENDIRLVPGYIDSGDTAVEQVAFELGLGRETVLSRDGRELAAERWFAGDQGPDTAMARQAPAHCGTCGFMVGLAGSLSAGFGVCANEAVEADGRVVSVEFGCGAHSSVRETPTSAVDLSESVWDDGEEFSAER